MDEETVKHVLISTWEAPKSFHLACSKHSKDLALEMLAIGAAGCLFDETKGNIDVMLAEWKQVYEKGVEHIKNKDRMENKK